MDMNKSFGEDKKSAEEGKWFDLEHGGRALVSKLGNPKFQAEVQRLSKPHMALLRSTMDTTELLNKITTDAMSTTILLDFEGVTLDGEPVDYSKETSKMLLTDFPAFRETISAISADRRNFSPEDLAGK